MTQLTAKQLEDILEGFRKEHREAPERIAEIMRRPRSEWPLLPVFTGWGGELFLAETLTDPDRVRLTQDGLPCMGETWSTGDGEMRGEEIYFEVWDLSLGYRRSHGYVDAVSRYLVQTG